MSFLYSQMFIKPVYPTKSFAEKTVIITGSNVGLGMEAAKHFTRLDAAKVILAVRNTKAGQEAKEKILEELKKPDTIEVWELDLASYDSVKAFAKRATKELDRIDVLCENAGIATEKFKILEKDESTITVNVVSTFLLAFLMLPKLAETAAKHSITPILTIVSSEVHAWPKFVERNSANIFETISDESKAAMNERYPLSKLLEVLTCRQISAAVHSKYDGKVVLNYLNPGLCHSALAREMDGWGFWLMKLVLARTTEVGSRTLVAAACDFESHGKYMCDGVVHDDYVAPWIKTPEGDKVGSQVWRELKAKLESIEEGCTEGF